MAGLQGAHQIFQTVVQMVLDQGFLGLLNRFFHRLQLLRDIKAASSLHQHFYCAAQVSAGFAQAFDDGRMGGMCMRLFHGQFYPLGEVTIIFFNVHETQLHAMSLRASSCLYPNGAALCMRWLVLVAIMFGTILSSMGGTSSHGLAAMATTFHDASSATGEAHSHVHEDEDGESAVLDKSADAGHAHHGADHSHDNAHALPVALSSAAPQLPGWRVRVRPWIQMVEASRLERPPMG